jgi:RNA recognition motif-containing protein
VAVDGHGKKVNIMSNKLFVGGLSWDTTSDDLRRAFEGFCSVADVKVISDRDTGRSRGFGFVTLSDASEMQSAIQQMDGFMLDGRNLRVNEANDRPAPTNRRY